VTRRFAISDDTVKARVAMTREIAIVEPLTANDGQVCSGPKCTKLVNGKAQYCGQHCRNNAHALRRVRELLNGMSDAEVMTVIRG